MKSKILLSESQYKKLIKDIANHQLKNLNYSRARRREIINESFLQSTSDTFQDIISAFYDLNGGPTKRWNKVVRKLNDAKLGQFLLNMTLRDKGYLGESLDWLDSTLSTPVYADDLGKVYSFWSALIKKDEEHLPVTKIMMALYAQRNMTLVETILDTINPADPFNLICLALAPVTGGASLLALGGKKALKNATNKQLKYMALRSAKKQGAPIGVGGQEIIDGFEGEIKKKYKKAVSKKMSKEKRRLRFYDSVADSSGQVSALRKTINDRFGTHLDEIIKLSDTKVSEFTGAVDDAFEEVFDDLIRNQVDVKDLFAVKETAKVK